MPSTSSKEKSKKKTANKTAFVLGLPHSIPASEVVAKGKAAGIVLSNGYVYVVRSKAKAKTGKPAGRRGRPLKVTAVKTARQSKGSVSSLAVQFVDAALDLGLARAEELLANLRGKLKQVIG
jgi:hypothetical protein